ncbi:hypothetical protein PU02_0230 [Bartonella ancashensis]|uniref:Uncharacterized protein n=1 Tax=Bartonella ancashensis TaxID=1318743 RepID=A0A0M4LFL5_9HYPH|nr:hypothetical protein PU02_0230 [Bartonella ancashensis]
MKIYLWESLKETCLSMFYIWGENKDNDYHKIVDKNNFQLC